MTNETYLLLLNGKRYQGITLDEAKQQILDAGHSYAYAQHLIDHAILGIFLAVA